MSDLVTRLRGLAELLRHGAARGWPPPHYVDLVPDEAADEIERLGGCNEALGKSHAEQRNLLQAEIESLRTRTHEIQDETERTTAKCCVEGCTGDFLPCVCADCFARTAAAGRKDSLLRVRDAVEGLLDSEEASP